VGRTRVYFITDVHGSNRCFKKFLNAAKFYGADVLILGGDITGKVLIPIVEQNGGDFRTTYLGKETNFKNRKEVVEFEGKVADSGVYAHILNRSEFEELEADPGKVSALFKDLMVERLREWIALAEERLGRSSVKCLISPGNDDVMEVDQVLNSSSYVVNPEGRVVEIDGEHEMITLGYTNHTPWNSPREVDEDVLAEKIKAMADKVGKIESAIFNIHVPPIDTPIDQAPRVDQTLRIVVRAGSVEMISAGSSACRAAVEKYQPMLGLHGHIHESRGIVKIGRTLCANPGSEYGEGILRGFVADLEGTKMKSYLLTSG
jgi:uncharacterized protein